MPETAQQPHSDSFINYLLAAFGTLTGVITVLYHRITKREDETSAQLKQERAAALQVLEHSAQTNETVSREVLTTLREMKAEQERTRTDLDALVRQQELSDRRADRIAEAVETMAEKFVAVLDALKDQGRDIKDLIRAIRQR